MKKYYILFVILLLSVVAFKAFSPKVQPVETQDASPAIRGIGALGMIDPRSRVIKLSHDEGPEGARVQKMMVKEGAEVKEGDIIAYFSDHERKESKLEVAHAQIGVLEAKLRAEKANFAFVKEDYARVGELIKVKAISQKEMQERRRNYDQSRATLDSLEADLESATAQWKLAAQELKQTYVTAPINGRILKIHAWPGERVGDEGVATVADLSRLDVVAEIYERDMPRIREGQKATIKVAGFKEPFQGEVYQLGYSVMKNDLNSTDPLADRDNRVVEIRIALPTEAAMQLQHLIYMQVDVKVEE